MKEGIWVVGKKNQMVSCINSSRMCGGPYRLFS